MILVKSQGKDNPVFFNNSSYIGVHVPTMPVDRKKIFSAISMHFNVIAKSKGKAEYMCVNVIMLPASYFDIYG